MCKLDGSIKRGRNESNAVWISNPIHLERATGEERIPSIGFDSIRSEAPVGGGGRGGASGSICRSGTGAQRDEYRSWAQEGAIFIAEFQLESAPNGEESWIWQLNHKTNKDKKTNPPTKFHLLSDAPPLSSPATVTKSGGKKNTEEIKIPSWVQPMNPIFGVDALILFFSSFFSLDALRHDDVWTGGKAGNSRVVVVSLFTVRCHPFGHVARDLTVRLFIGFLG